MSQKHFLLAILILTITGSCRKVELNANKDLIGDWAWKSSYSSGNVTMLPSDTTRIFLLQFKSDYGYLNNTICVLGGPSNGNYQIQSFDNHRILILKSQNNYSDTFRLNLTTNSLTLTETNNGYSWFHHFSRIDK